MYKNKKKCPKLKFIVQYSDDPGIISGHILEVLAQLKSRSRHEKKKFVPKKKVQYSFYGSLLTYYQYCQTYYLFDRESLIFSCSMFIVITMNNHHVTSPKYTKLLTRATFACCCIYGVPYIAPHIENSLYNTIQSTSHETKQTSHQIESISVSTTLDREHISKHISNISVYLQI